MKVISNVELTRDEVQKTICYSLICETREGSRWGTGKRKRRWHDEFTEDERGRAVKLFKLARDWYLITGVPETVTMTTNELLLWDKLESFCASL